MSNATRSDLLVALVERWGCHVKASQIRCYGCGATTTNLIREILVVERVATCIPVRLHHLMITELEEHPS
jgi:hypothetical protein